MGKLIQNEWIKLFRQVGTYILIGLLLLIIIGSAVLTKSMFKGDSSQAYDWRQDLIIQNEGLEEELKDLEFMPKSYEKMVRNELMVNEYRLEHDLAVTEEYTKWEFLMNSASLTHVVGLIAIIIAARIVANEFNWGTIKVLLIKPFSRWKILMSKYMAVIAIYIMLLFILFIVSFILSSILFTNGPESSNVFLQVVDGKVVEKSMVSHIAINYLLTSINYFMLMTMAFMISSAFRTSSLAIGISITLVFAGGGVTQLLADKFEWAKYILFANVDLLQYDRGELFVEGMTMQFSIIMLIIYFILFHLLALLFFGKRDVS